MKKKKKIQKIGDWRKYFLSDGRQVMSWEGERRDEEEDKILKEQAKGHVIRSGERQVKNLKERLFWSIKYWLVEEEKDGERRRERERE